MEAAEREGERLRDRIAELQIHAEDLKQTAEQRVTEAEQRAEEAEQRAEEAEQRAEEAEQRAEEAEQRAEEAEQHAVERQHSRPPAAAMSQRMKPALPKSATSGAGPATSSDHALKAEEKARKQAQAAVARAQSLEAVVASLTEKLLEAESSVRMLRTQLRRCSSSTTTRRQSVSRRICMRAAGWAAWQGVCPVECANVPTLARQSDRLRPRALKGCRDEFQREEERQQRALHKMREEACTTEAFPDYGRKTRSGLRGIGQKRIEENREQMERRRKQERRRKHLEALQQHGLSPSSRHERLLAQRRRRWGAPRGLRHPSRASQCLSVIDTHRSKIVRSLSLVRLRYTSDVVSSETKVQPSALSSVTCMSCTSTCSAGARHGTGGHGAPEAYLLRIA